MSTFIVAIPLFDKNMIVNAYHLCDHNSDRLLGTSFNFQMFGDALTTRGLDLIEKVGLDPFTGGQPLFTDINQYQLMMGIPQSMDIGADKLICTLPKDIIDSDEILERCDALINKGYRLALSHAPASATYSSVVKRVDFIFLDYLHPFFNAQLKDVLPYVGNKMLIVLNVPDTDAFSRLQHIPNALFTGKFYDQPISEGVKDISPLKVNALQLLREVNEIDSDLIKISETIERDPSISISLLRFINSPGVPVSRRVESIRSAVALLGQVEIKRWVMVAVSVQLAKDRPGEITKLSLVRARFAENLARAYQIDHHSPSLFMAGLFSLLDIILEKPMEQAIREVAVNEQVRDALVNKAGVLHEVMDLIYAYERADWDAVSINMIRNHIEADDITDAFMDALVWYRDLLQDIDKGA